VANNNPPDNGPNTGTGGGIYNEGTLNLNSVDIQNNKTTLGALPLPLGSGGGIFNNGSMHIVNSTISGLAAQSGFSFTGHGGGICNGNYWGLFAKRSCIFKLTQ